jgi:predicted dehydrogenase
VLKIAIIGCGKISDAHVAQIQRIKDCGVVAVCDSEELMARQLAHRFGIPQCFADLDELLRVAKPDVVHITTPPQSHFAIAKRCLEQGCHVYVEKPFAVDLDEAKELVDLAVRSERRITAGHDDQFRHAARRMRELVGKGYLGGPPVHMESYYCYELGGGAYARAVLGDKGHWVRRLPGGLVQNVISHGIARIAEFLTTDNPEVIVHAFASPALQRLGETGIVDEVRVIVSEAKGTTAYFTFSSQMRPSLHQFRIYGPANGLLVDQDNETLIKLPGTRYKSYLEQFGGPLAMARQYVRNACYNMRTFLGRDFHSKAGMKYLIEMFYASIRSGSPLPISYREILLTTRIMDQIFKQFRVQAEHPDRSGSRACPQETAQFTGR